MRRALSLLILFLWLSPAARQAFARAVLGPEGGVAGLILETPASPAKPGGISRAAPPTPLEVESGIADGPNLYAYCAQNPWSKFDPEGLEWFVENWSDVPAVLTGLGKSYVNAVAAPFVMPLHSAVHPIDSATSLKNLVVHPVDSGKAVVKSVADKWKSGPEGKGEILMDGLIAVASGKFIKGGTTSTVANKAGELTSPGKIGVGLDTNAIIARLEGDGALQNSVTQAMAGRIPRVSITAVKEFLQGGGDIGALRSFLSSNGGGVSKAAQGSTVAGLMGKGLKAADSNVVGSAMREGTELLTRDKKILKNVPDVANPF